MIKIKKKLIEGLEILYKIFINLFLKFKKKNIERHILRKNLHSYNMVKIKLNFCISFLTQ